MHFMAEVALLSRYESLVHLKNITEVGHTGYIILPLRYELKQGSQQLAQFITLQGPPMCSNISHWIHNNLNCIYWQKT